MPTVAAFKPSIQSLDLFFRKIVRDRGEALQFLTAQVSRTIDTCAQDLKPHAELLQTALDDVTAMTGALTGYLMSAGQHPSEIYKVGLGSVRYLLAVGDLLIGWRLLAQAEIARAAITNGASVNDEAFYQGKIATAAFFAKNMLPKLTAQRKVLESIDGEISLLWQDVDAYRGDVILMSLDTDEPLRMNTFEISGELAARLKDGVLEEGMRVRVRCRAETIEVVNLETGETSDGDVPVVVDVTVLTD